MLLPTTEGNLRDLGPEPILAVSCSSDSCHECATVTLSPADLQRARVGVGDFLMHITEQKNKSNLETKYLSYFINANQHRENFFCKETHNF